MTKKNTMQNEFNQMGRRQKADIVAEYKRHHRVSDTRGLSKSELITAILVARHGIRAVSEALYA